MNASRHQGDVPTPPDRSTVILLLGTIADTTWRMFVPVIGLLLVGVWLDKTFGMLPIGTISLTIIGAFIAAILVRHQIHTVKKK